MRLEVNYEKKTAKHTIDKIDLTDIYRTFHSKWQNTLSSQMHTEHSPG